MSCLSDLSLGEAAYVNENPPSATGSRFAKRLLELGLIAGTRVECVAVAPLGDPRAYLIRGAVVALRREDSDAIKITLPVRASLPVNLPVNPPEINVPLAKSGSADTVGNSRWV